MNVWISGIMWYQVIYMAFEFSKLNVLDDSMPPMLALFCQQDYSIVRYELFEWRENCASLHSIHSNRISLWCFCFIGFDLMITRKEKSIAFFLNGIHYTSLWNNFENSFCLFFLQILNFFLNFECWWCQFEIAVYRQMALFVATMRMRPSTHRHTHWRRFNAGEAMPLCTNTFAVRQLHASAITSVCNTCSHIRPSQSCAVWSNDFRSS